MKDSPVQPGCAVGEKIVPVVVGVTSPFLLAFLHGTVQSQSPLSKLRGQEHVLRIIWNIVCEEWLDLHVYRSSPLVEGIPVVSPWTGEYPSDARQPIGGCPVAVVAPFVEFPPLCEVPVGFFGNQENADLYVNMMPIDLFDENSLPPPCSGYWPMIEECKRVVDMYQNAGERSLVAYLTIDERPVPTGTSQRRPGLHVESPGVMPLIQSICAYTILSASGAFVPGAEHHWGGGLMIRDEYFEGGIFMASNIADTTAVWNCTINDEDGEFIGAHGDIEYLRGLIGPCARTLDAGELIWMTDRTPHESLPILAASAAAGTRRQYFRLVVGQVSAWFADHSTPNPLGTVPPPEVRIVYGDKFELYPTPTRSWHCGSPEQINNTKLFLQLRERLYRHGLGHMTKCAYDYGLRSIHDVYRTLREIKKNQNPAVELSELDWDPMYSADGRTLLFTNRGCWYYERMNWSKMLLEIQDAVLLPPPVKKGANKYGRSPPPMPVRTTAKSRHASAVTADKSAGADAVKATISVGGTAKTSGAKTTATPRWK